MGIPEYLPWKTYQGDSESLNPFVLLSSCKYSCLKVSIRVWVAAMRFWCIPLSPMGPKQAHSEVKTARNKSGGLGSGGRGIWYRTDGKGCHGSCLVSVGIFPKRSGFIASRCVKRKDLLLVWDSQSKWTSAELFCLSLAVLHSCGLSATSSLQASPFDGRDCVHPSLVLFAILLIPSLVNQFSPLLFCLTWQRTEKCSDQC